jgi:hypothetical protein
MAPPDGAGQWGLPDDLETLVMACAAQDDASIVCGNSVHFTLGLARIRHRRHPELADAVKLHQPMGIPLARDLYLFGVDLLALWLWQYSNIAGGWLSLHLIQGCNTPNVARKVMAIIARCCVTPLLVRHQPRQYVSGGRRDPPAVAPAATGGDRASLRPYTPRN